MIHKKPSEYAGKTVKLKPTVVGMRGKLFEVEDYWDRVDGKSWMACVGNMAVLSYSIRAGVSNNLGITIPLDNEVLYGKLEGMGYLVHVCELDTENC